MAENLRLMCILAHPDDESLGTGGILARYAAEGVETFLVTATRGERGRYGNLGERPSLKEVGEMREAELHAAARTLGVGEVALLDYIDGDLDKADQARAVAKIVDHIRRFRPQVVVTFGPEGAYGHPDHIAISQFATAAVICSANPDYPGYDAHSTGPAHQVLKLYYMAWERKTWEAYLAAFRDLKVVVDGVERRASPVPDWLITTKIDTSKYWKTVWEAVLCHQTQLAIYSKLESLSEEHHRSIWGTQQYYRAMSTVNGGRGLETDLFEGIRKHDPQRGK